MNINKTLTSWLVPILLLSLSIPAAAAGDQETPTFGEILDVRVLNLEVVVTQRGERVRGLTSDDFRLVVDGQEVPIEYFTEIDEGRAVRSANPSPAVPAVAPGEAVGTRYLVFVDDYFSVPSYRNQALRALSDQLTLLAPEDRMAIVAFDGREVEMLSSWTRSLVQLKSAIDTAARRRGYGLQRLSEQRRYDTLARFEGRSLGVVDARFFGRGINEYEGLGLAR